MSNLRLFLMAMICAPLLVAAPLHMATANEPARRHAIARIGDPKFAPGFKAFDWVNPSAPKGGTVRVSATGTFDNLNPSTIKGTIAPGISLVDATLFTPSLDEPATAYGFVAEWIQIPDDFSFATFGLRPEARFNDGTPITPDDVLFSFQEQIKASPSIAIYYRDVAKVEKSGDREVTFRFVKAGNRDLPYLVSLLSVLPKHHWTGRDKSGEPRSLSNTTLEPPLGAGPYRIAAVDQGRSIVYARVQDWWARDLSVNAGQYNFDAIRYTMYRDDVPEFEALKSGEIDVTQESSSKRWATGYDVPPVRNGDLKKLPLPLKTVANLQFFAFNTRRQKFADARVRRAFALAYDFESANKSLFYGLYRRTNSIFDNSELAHRDLPQGRELQILEKVRAQVPPEVFTAPYKAPVNDSADVQRRNLREAGRLLDEAGWTVKDGLRRHVKSGEVLSVEFLNYDTGFDRIVLPYKQSLERLGVRFSIRIVDPTQYENRVKTFDFDMITDAHAMSHAPGNEQRELWGSDSAGKEASRNRVGIRNSAVDAIIEDLIYARSRDDLIAATRALDRVILWNHYLVPQWFNSDAWVAHWDKFGRPEPHPSQDPSVLTTWWIDPLKAQSLEARRGKN